MKNNRLKWLMIALVISVTLVVTFGTLNSRSQEKIGSSISISSTPDSGGFRDRSRYAIADYDEPLPSDVELSKSRKSANSRYDGMGWVFKSPYSDGTGVGLEDEKVPPPAAPVSESALIVIGKITESHAHMSNDKLGVYTEFTIQIKEILKNDADKNLASDQLIVVDREGGYVRYSNGQKVFYENSNRALPQPGSEYAFFLTSDKQSPNYNILTLYELKDNSIARLDYVQYANEFKDATPAILEQAIRNKMTQLSRSPK